MSADGENAANPGWSSGEFEIRVLRPWDVFWEQDETMLLGVGIPDREPSDDPEAPPDRLVRLARALGDERRLRILRRLLAATYTLQELAEHFGTPKTTLLHHLAVKHVFEARLLPAGSRPRTIPSCRLQDRGPTLHRRASPPSG